MKKGWKQIAASWMAVVLFLGLGNTNAFAAAPYKPGQYTAKITFLHESKDKESMCNSLFDQDADVKIKGDTAEIRIYTAFPVPMYASQGADGTVKDMVMTLDEAHYKAESDITTKPVRTMDEKGLMFGIKAGAQLTTQILTFSIPVEKLDRLSSNVPVTAFVNVVMKKDMNFRLRLNDLQLVEEEKPPQEIPDATTNKSMQLTANVGSPKGSYTVTIPESIALGTLSAEKENVMDYTVEVTAEQLGSGYVEVSTAASGALQCGENALAYTNSFGTQKTQETTALKGKFTVKAADVQAAAAGSYTGTTDFLIRYFAGA